jgi:beta-lactam-binding protein with PASTA domain
VPKLIGADESSVDLLLSRSHLITGTVTPVVSLARAGTVIAENSPAGTIEPSSSIVDVTISAGGAAVPELESLTQGQDRCIRAEAPNLVVHGSRGSRCT